jgi:hypothetical protein
MSQRPRPRPRFELVTQFAPSEVRLRVQALLKRDRRLRGIAFEHRLELAIGSGESHFYSPQLVVKVEPEPSGGARLRVRVGPDPYVWAFYLLGTGMLTVLTLFAILFGVVQLSLGQTPTALYVAPGAALVAGLVFGASFVGQGLGHEQIYFLRSSLTDTLEAAEVEPSARRPRIGPRTA